MSIPLLCEIIAQGGKALAATFHGHAAYVDLVRAALVRESGVVQSIVCDACDSPHDAEVLFEGGEYGHFCPELGFVTLGRDQFVGVEPDLGKLVDALATAFDCKRRKSKPIHGATWRVGVIDTDQGGVAVYLHPRLQDGSDLDDLETALKREVASPFSVTLTACGSLAAAGCRTINLADAVDLDPAASALGAVSDLPAVAGVQPVRTSGAPNIYKAALKAIIEERKRNGSVLPGTNAEARAIIEIFRQLHPSLKAPSRATVQRYM